MSMKAQILFLFSIYCFLIGSTPVMKAQTGKFYSTDKELSNSLINAVYQDRKGFIWIVDFFQWIFHTQSQEFPFIFNLLITIVTLFWAYRRRNTFLFNDQLK